MDTPTPPRSERGASAVEYGLLIAGIAAIIVVAVFAVGGIVNGTLFGETCDKINQQVASADC
jgi:pilus assembly protein Flp/PilA